MAYWHGLTGPQPTSFCNVCTASPVPYSPTACRKAAISLSFAQGKACFAIRPFYIISPLLSCPYMYNLTIEKVHTFFVGEGRWWAFGRQVMIAPVQKPLSK
jgi:hypothetical protein